MSEAGASRKKTCLVFCIRLEHDLPDIPGNAYIIPAAELVASNCIDLRGAVVGLDGMQRSVQCAFRVGLFLFFFKVICVIFFD